MSRQTKARGIPELLYGGLSVFSEGAAPSPDDIRNHIGFDLAEEPKIKAMFLPSFKNDVKPILGSTWALPGSARP